MDKMNNKKGLWGTVVGILFAILLVAAVFSIVFKSSGLSLTSITDNIKKLGISEPNKAEAVQDTKPCILKRYYWSPEQAKIGSTVQIVVEGDGACSGKTASIVVFESALNKQKRQQEEIKILDKNQPFVGNIIKLDVNIEHPGAEYELDTAYFTIQFGNYNEASKLLQIVT